MFEEFLMYRGFQVMGIKVFFIEIVELVKILKMNS